MSSAKKSAMKKHAATLRISLLSRGGKGGGGVPYGRTKADNGLVGHGSNGSTNVNGSRGSWVSAVNT